MLILNMGLFWKRADVFWGKPGPNGTAQLLGKRPGNSGCQADFWNQVGIYILYSEYRLIYVGQAGSGNQALGFRLRTHTRDNLAGRWDCFSWFGICKVLKDGDLQTFPGKRSLAPNETLNLIEGILINAAEPPLNRQGGRLPNVDNYIQCRHPLLGPPSGEALSRILRAVEA